ncbi:MAG: glycosyltransferase [Anaerolineae bacterium]|nr:glycosyltransferase [Anaerolineae bacterium]
MVYERIALVVPVYNDWTSFGKLLADLDRELIGLENELHVFAINDGSPNDANVFQWNPRPNTVIARTEIIHLMCNLGHQRAIAVGLSEVLRREVFDAVLVMDADGEDRPQEVPNLLAAHREQPHAVIAARRTKRSEGPVFRFFYRLYMLLFRLLIGKTINFGNFCLIPAVQLRRIMHKDKVWNHLAASLQQPSIPLVRIDTYRGQRYAGHSSMNLVSLIVHGLSAIAVYPEVVFVRVGLMSLLLALAALTSIVVVIIIRLFTDLAIPGWATYTVGILLVILFQSLVFSGGAIFFVLSERSRPLLIPALDILRYIDYCEVVHDRTGRI